MSNLNSNTTQLEILLEKVNALPEASNGIDTSDATATDSDILSNKTAYVNGEKITGTMDRVELPKPSVIISSYSTGQVTATVETTESGYVAAGKASETLQLPTDSGGSFTPTTTDQIVIGSGKFLTGAVMVKGEANLVAENIAEGVSIFGVVGTATAGGGGDTSAEDGLVTRTLTTYTNNRVTSVGNYAFEGCKSLTSVNFPSATSIGGSAFAFCSSLTSVNFPLVTSIGGYAFTNCTSLTSVNFPLATSIGGSAFANCIRLTSVSFPLVTSISSYAFRYCSSLTSVNFPLVTSISGYAFQYCSKLASIYFGASTVCTLNNSNAFSGTGIWSNKGSIFVPTSLVASYKAATNWTFFSNRIFGM